MEKNRGQFFILFFINFFFFMGINSMNILPAYLDTMGAGSGVIALFTTVPILFLVVLVVLQIVRKKSFNKLRLVKIGFLLSIVCMTGLYSFHSNLIIMFLMYLGTGLTYGAGFTNVFSMMYDIVPDNKRRSSAAIFGISGLMSSGVAALISEYVYTNFSNYNIFLIPIVFSGLALLLTLFIKIERFVVVEKELFQFDKFIGSKEIRLLIVLSLVFGGGFGIFKSFLPIITEARLGEVDITRFFILYTIAGLSYRLIFARLMDKVGRNLLLLSGFVLMGGSILALNFITHLYELYIIGAVYGLAHSLLFPTMSAEFVKNGGENRAAYNNIFLALFTIGITIISSALGILGDFFGLSSIPWLMSGMIAIAVIVTIVGRKEI